MMKNLTTANNKPLVRTPVPGSMEIQTLPREHHHISIYPIMELQFVNAGLGVWVQV